MAVLVKTFPAPALSVREILRYAGSPSPDAATLAVMRQCVEIAQPILTYKTCFCTFDVQKDGEWYDLGFCRTKSRTVATYLTDCERLVLFGATVGLRLDREIAKYAAISPVMALFLDAIGNERIEALCDAFENEVRADAEEEGFVLRPRISPGYGDFSIETQRDIFAALNCPRQIGLTLNESLMMSPSKSVTAIIGWKRT